MNIIKLLSLSLICLMLMTCKKDRDVSVMDIEVNSVEVDVFSAKIFGEYIFETEMKDFFVVYGLTSDLTETENVKMDVDGKALSAQIDNLQRNTLYYYCIECRSNQSYIRNEINSFRTNNLTLPEVVTNDVIDITQTTAQCRAELTNDGGDVNTVRGVCWSVSQNPTIADSCTVDGIGVGPYYSNLSGLMSNTKYYVRAYATNAEGTSYGVQKEFTTLLNVELPIVVTGEISNISQTTAQCSGNVTFDGNAAITARGVCWSQSQNPTIADSNTTDGSGVGVFLSDLTNLTENTLYYVRAYATNSKGTSYGEQKEFTTLLEVELPEVTTNEISDVTQSTLQCGGDVTFDGNASIIARGICWSISPNPTLNDDHTVDGTGAGIFNSTATNLYANTTYYIRAYATNSKGTNYGEQKSVTTLDFENGDINGYGYADLGLPSGLKWAVNNVGAASYSDYGDYYAWGEIEMKTSYNPGNSITYGHYVADFSGNERYDVARNKWGETWRIPTQSEMQELVNKCTWIWTTIDGTSGYKVIGPNGNYIFLPAAGYRYDVLLYYDGDYGHYWTSKPNDAYTDNVAYYLHLSNVSRNVGSQCRYYGYSIRAVSD